MEKESAAAEVSIMLSRIALLSLAFGLISVPRTEAAAPPNSEQETVAKVNKAIDTGVQYLRVNRKAANHWEGFWLNAATGMEGGVTALGCLAMLNCGVRPDDKDLSAALDSLRRIEPVRTYVAALTIMCMAETRNPKDLPVIEKNINFLVKIAHRERNKLAGWGYPLGGDFERADASNTQYALLGLYAGKQAGAKIPEALWKEIRELYISTQIQETRDTGFWSYSELQKTASFTMSAAGVSGLVIARMGLNESTQQLNLDTGVAAKCGEYAENEPIRRGLNWIGSEKRFSFDKALQSKSTFYNIYGIERVGRLSGQRFIGKYDWYREGCDYLVRSQNKDGSWSADSVVAEDQTKVIATSFALLFLSKGRSPVLISKLAHGDAVITGAGVLVEKGDSEAVVDWNRKQNDARNIADYASRELFKNLPLGWQVYDPRRKEFPKEQDILDEVGQLVQSPILFFNGHKAPKLTGQQEKLLKKYIEEGGFVIAEACCGKEEFTVGFRELMKRLFPESELKPMAPEHAMWRTHFAVPPTAFKNVECLDRGCRTVLVFFPEPISGYWEESKYMAPTGKAAANRGESAFHLAMNIVAYATGMEPPKQKLTTRKIADSSAELAPVKGFLKPVQIKIGEQPPAPAAMRNLMSFLRDEAKLDVVVGVEQLKPNDEDLFKYKFLYMHGRKSFEFDTEDIDNILATLQSGGLLLADACCGQAEFDKAFRSFAAKLFPQNKLEPIPVDDLLYSEKLNRTAIKTVKRREKAANAQAGNDTGYEDLPPALEGIKINGRWVMIYSKYDLGCALENHKSTDCLGHTPDSARRLAAAAVLYSLKR